MLNNEFELPDGSCSVSVIQGYIEYIMKIQKNCQLILLVIFTSTELIVE